MERRIFSGKYISKTRREDAGLFKYASILAVGGAGYYALELMWRGHSHWSMAVCGAICLLAMYEINRLIPHSPLLLRALACAVAITAVEFITGCIVNIWLGWQVWDYHEAPFNLLGQICLLFSFLWFLLSLPVCTAYTLIEIYKSRKNSPKEIL